MGTLWTAECDGAWPVCLPSCSICVDMIGTREDSGTIRRDDLINGDYTVVDELPLDDPLSCLCACYMSTFHSNVPVGGDTASRPRDGVESVLTEKLHSDGTVELAVVYVAMPVGDLRGSADGDRESPWTDVKVPVWELWVTRPCATVYVSVVAGTEVGPYYADVADWSTP